MARRTLAAGAVAAAAVVFGAGPALAHECTNASKKPGAGAQAVIDANTDEIISAKNGALKRVEKFGEDAIHGLIALDFDGDGIADADIFLPGNEQALIPTQAQENGPVCRGLTNIDAAFEAGCIVPSGAG